jgi:hypothetical protein
MTAVRRKNEDHQLYRESGFNHNNPHTPLSQARMDGVIFVRIKNLAQIGELISDTPDGENILRFFCIFFYSESQAADMDVHGA